MVLESRGLARDALDRRTIAAALRLATGPDIGVSDRTNRRHVLAYVHLAAHQEPALWIPDAVAWCYGAGGEWRRRVSTLVDSVADLGQV